jgi:YidC/Oxa1 family membrane protein insertase
VQRNFALFLVLSFGVLLGWMALVAYLRPVATLKITVADGVDRENVRIVAKSADGERKLDLKASEDAEGNTVKRQLMTGDYELTLEGDAAAGWMLSESRVKFTKEVLEGQVEIVKRPEQKKPEIAEKPPGDKPPVAPIPDDPAVNPPVPAVAEKVARQQLAIGSVDPNGSYRLLATFDSLDAVVERIELASHRYHDLEDESGYLGQLAATDVPKGEGALVGVVGAGTPAHAAGLKSGDVLVKIDDEKVVQAEAVEGILASKRPGDEVELSILRDNRPMTLQATLVRHPMQIVRPELENRQHRKESPEAPTRGANDQLSYLLSLQRVGDEKPEDIKLSGVNWKVTAHDEKSVEFQHTLDKLGLRLTKRFELAQLTADDAENPDARAYHLTLKVTIEQLKDGARKIAYRLDGPTGLPTEGWWYSRLGMRDYFVAPIGDEGERTGFFTTHCIDIAKRPEDNDGIRLNETLEFVGINAQYFAAAMLPKHKELLDSRPIVVSGDIFPKHENLTNITCRLTSEAKELAKAGDKIVHEYELFAGPKRPALLTEYGLTPAVDYGWWGWAWIAKLLQSVLHTFYALVGNYGVAILMLTVVVRLAMFPLSRKQVLGAMKMQELQPEMKQINETYKKDLEARNRALSQLFRKHNYHPLSGCLPIFIQLPIFIGLYNALWVDVELRQAPLIPGLAWCSNLAAPDMLHDWSSWMPDFVINGGLFGMLPPAMGPYFNVLPIITVALMMVQQKLFTPPPTNEQAEMQQKIMKYMMIIMCFLFYKVASGLCLYFICSSTWGLAERKLMPKPAPKTGDDSIASQQVVSRPVKPASNGSAKAKNKKRQKGR